MSNLWNVVSDVNRGEKNDKQHAQLNAVQTRISSTRSKEDVLTTQAPTPQPRLHKASRIDASSVQTPEDALQLLRSEPDTDSLLTTLKRLSTVNGLQVGFDVHSPSPMGAQIVNTIVTSIVPTFWSALEEQDRALITAALLNVAGLNSVIARIQLLISQTKNSKARDHLPALQDVFDVANSLFKGDDRVSSLWAGLWRSTQDKMKRDLAWKECSSLLGSGKVSNVLAEAEDVLRANGSDHAAKSPIANSHQYATWLGSNIAQSLDVDDPEGQEEAQSVVAILFARSLSLGQPVALMRATHTKILQGPPRASAELVAVVKKLPAFAQRRYLDYTLRWIAGIESRTSGPDYTLPGQAVEAAAIAAFLQRIATDNDLLKQNLASVLSDPAQVSSLSLLAIRSSIAALNATCPDDLDSLVERCLKVFGEQMFVRHSPILQQESIAQALLIAAGYVHRRSPMALLMTVRSSGHMQGVSNRLDASNARARWLGMIVGTALSSLVDKEGSKLSFGTDDMQGPEADRYFALIKTNDQPSTLGDFLKLVAEKPESRRSIVHRATKPPAMPKIDGKPTFGPVRPPAKPAKAQTEIEGNQITEISDSDSDDDDGLTPYAKPDSDAEDSDEDATLVNRDKTRAPVYIRDLMSMLRNTEKHDRFELGIKHAAPLIRRKSTFGREVIDHAEELARILCSLQDPFDTDNFEEMQLQALIAVILSDASAIAPWLSRQAFAGEFSISQRCVMLTALGLSGRELAGLKELDGGLNPEMHKDTSFPSKKLPPHLHSLYSSSSSSQPNPASTKRLEAASSSLEHALLQPMALSAADKTTAHLNAVKVRTFSSRMAVARTRRKPTPNKLALIFPQAYFHPLLTRYQQEIAAYGSASVWSTTPFLLVTLIKTLALLFHASGPATLGLSSLTTDFWDLLLALRVRAVGHVNVLEALLFGFLTVLQVNEDKQAIAQVHSKQLLETQQWADMVFERTGQGRLVQQEGQGEEAKVRTLAAAVLVNTGEVMEAHRKVLMGDMMGM
jgi:telomere length regulation protein